MSLMTNNGIPEATDKPTEAKDNKKDNETVATTKNDDPNYDTITLSDSDLHNGSLVMVSNTCPYSGTSKIQNEALKRYQKV